MTRLWRWVIFAFLALTSTQFLLLGPRRAITGGLDLAAPYAGAKAWVQGRNPYDSAVLSGVLRKSKREAEANPAFTPALYPPPTFIAVLPLVPLAWPAARVAWLLISLTLIGVALHSLIRMAGVSVSSFGALLVAGGALSLAPFATGIALGQLAVASIALVVIAIERVEAGSEFAAGSLLGVALLLKPQIAGLFVLSFLIRGPRRAAWLSLALLAMATAVSVGWLHRSGVDWISSWTQNSLGEFVGGGIDPRGPLSAQMVDPRPLFSALLDVQRPFWIGLVIASVAGALLLHLGRRLDQRYNLLLAANVAVLTLFVGYHRFYDAALLCLPLTWAVATAWRDDPLRKHALAALLCIAPFFASGAWTLQRLSNEGAIPNAVSQSFFWDAFVLRHQIWALLVLQAVLLAAVWRSAKASATAAGTAAH